MNSYIEFCYVLGYSLPCMLVSFVESEMLSKFNGFGFEMNLKLGKGFLVMSIPLAVSVPPNLSAA